MPDDRSQGQPLVAAFSLLLAMVGGTGCFDHGGLALTNREPEEETGEDALSGVDREPRSVRPADGASVDGASGDGAAVASDGEASGSDLTLPASGVEAGGLGPADGGGPDAGPADPGNSPPLTRGLLLYLPLDDRRGTTNVSDRSPMAQGVRLRDRDPDNAWGSPGRLGGSLDLNGAGSSCGYLEVREPRGFEALSALSIALWVDTARARATGALVALTGQTDSVTTFGLSNDRLTASLDPNRRSPRATSTSRMPERGWTHAAVTYDGAVVRLYVNGRPAGATNDAGGLPSPAGSLTIGTFRGMNGFIAGDFCGRLDELLVYDRALAPEEVSDLARGLRPTVK